MDVRLDLSKVPRSLTTNEQNKSLGESMGLTIPTTDELEIATAHSFPHYSVQLPEWNRLTKNRLPDNVPVEPTYNGNHDLNCPVTLDTRLAPLRPKYPGKLDATRQNESTPNSELDDPLKKIPHPGSDCRHVDPGQAMAGFRADYAKMMAQLKNLEPKANTDGELRESFRRAVATLSDAEELLNGKPGGGGPRGMQRLGLIFEWMLCQVVTIFGEINAALDTGNETAYNTARNAYMDLMHDLDDSEPQTRDRIKSGASGYGLVIKWAYIIPLIHDGRIKGTKVMAKWNPHISSSGIPIPHA